MHTLLRCVIIAVQLSVTSAAFSEVTFTNGDDGLVTIRMTVTPAAEPTPALKYRFLTREIELQPGNSAPYYHRAIADIGRYAPRVRKLYGEDDYYSWCNSGQNGTRLRDLPLDKLRQANSALNYIVDDHVWEASRRRDCDWQLGFEEVRGPEVITIRLDEFQAARDVARTLILQSRLAVAERQFDEAIATIGMNYRLGRDVAKVPVMVCGLIGIAIETYSNETVIELISEAGSPNVYWALTELPQPLVDLRPAIRVEIDFGPRIFPFIHGAETTDHSPDEWNRLYTQAVQHLSEQGLGELPNLNPLGGGIAGTGLALLGYTHAKECLIADGMDPKRVEAMAVGQVMAVYTERNYERYASDIEILWYVPFWEMRKRFGTVERALHAAGPLEGGTKREVLPIMKTLLPAVEAIRAAQVRLERDIAAMRVIEALRMYAATHAGSLPQTLDEIREVPVPLNPATGKPFVYRLDGNMAVLGLPASDGIPNSHRRFEVTIVQTNKPPKNGADERR